MEVYIDGVRYIPEEPCCSVKHTKQELQVGDYVVIDDIGYFGYAVDAAVLGEAGKVIDWPHPDSFAAGQLAVEIPGYSILGQHIFGFWPHSLSRFEED